MRFTGLITVGVLSVLIGRYLELKLPLVSFTWIFGYWFGVIVNQEREND